MEKLKQFVLAGIDYLKANPVYAIILAAAVLALVVVLIVIIALSSKKRKAKKKAKAAALAQAKAEAEQKAAEEKAMAAQKAKEDAEAKRQATLAKLEADRKAAEEKAEAERLAKEQEEAEKKAAEERAEAERKAAEEREVTARIAAEKAEAERVAAEKAAAAKAEAERLAKEREEAEIAAAKKAAEAKAAYEKAEAERKAAEQAAAEMAIAAKIAEEKAAAVNTPEETVTETADKSDDNNVLYEQMKDAEAEDEIWYDENETDRAARYNGKWQICRVLTDDNAADEMYFFELHASNGEKLLSSEEYTSYNGALRGIQTHKTNILRGNFKITLSKKGDYIFKLMSGKNMLLCMGENYPTKARCESAIESAKRFAKTAVIDENVQDIVVKVPVEDDTPIQPLPDGVMGKWIVESTLGSDGEKLYYFELFANNGEKLLSSEEYTSYVGAINGIQTHKRNIEDCNFRITLTKRGDYIYKLLNGNGQLLCLGEHYKTKRLCQNAVESVKRFSVNAPILTDATNTQF